LQIPNEGALTINQYQWNQPAQVTLPGGHKQSYSYDPLQRVTQILAKDAADNALMDFQL
jgi:YD repeat-containing protein